MILFLLLGLAELSLLLVLYVVIDRVICHYRAKKYNISQNTVVLITGAAMGIGRRTALHFARNHKCIVLVYDILEEAGRRVIEELKAAGSTRATFYKCDLSQESEIERAFAESIKDFGFIDILINNAGIASLQLFTQTTYERIKRVMDINYLAPVSLTKKVYPLMLQQNRGHIVNISSVASISPSLKMAEYCASKAALSGFHNALRLEIKYQKKDNIFTTLVCPNAVNTGMFEGFVHKLDFLLPMLDEEYVGLEIYNSILSRRTEVFLPWYLKQISLACRLLPTGLMDFFGVYLFSENVTHLKGRQTKKND